MNKYFVYYPRNFANEFCIVAANSKDEINRMNNFIDMIDFTQSDCRSITLKEIKKLESIERGRKAWGEESFANFNPVPVDDFLN